LAIAARNNSGDGQLATLPPIVANVQQLAQLIAPPSRLDALSTSPVGH
jgi:hypothetical protein